MWIGYVCDRLHVNSDVDENTSLMGKQICEWSATAQLWKKKSICSIRLQYFSSQFSFFLAESSLRIDGVSLFGVLKMVSVIDLLLH